MKLTVEAADLKKALGRLDKVVPRAVTIPILNHVLILAQGDALVLRATDMDKTLVCRVPAQVEAPGVVAVPGARLRAVAAAAAAGAQIAFRTQGDGNALLARAGRARFRLPVLAPEDFPDEPTIDDASVFTLSGAAFLAAAARVSPAISTEETRYYLNGIFLHTYDDSLLLIATDGHKLFRAVLPRPEKLDADGKGQVCALARDPARTSEGGVIVPRGTVNILPACFGGCDEIEVAVNSSLIGFTAGGTRLVSKLIDGTFPDYERVIPKGEGVKIALPREAVLSALAGVSGFQDDALNRGVALRIDDGAMILAVQGKSGELAVEEVEVPPGAEKLETGVNGDYLREILASRPSKTVDLIWAAGQNMGPLRILDAELPGEVAVVMPIRMNFPDSTIHDLDSSVAAP